MDFESAYNSARIEGFDPEEKYKEKLRELWDQDLTAEGRIEAIREILQEATDNVKSSREKIRGVIGDDTP